jgi:hypothetical protein
MYGQRLQFNCAYVKHRLIYLLTVLLTDYKLGIAVDGIGFSDSSFGMRPVCSGNVVLIANKQCLYGRNTVVLSLTRAYVLRHY